MMAGGEHLKAIDDGFSEGEKLIKPAWMDCCHGSDYDTLALIGRSARLCLPVSDALTILQHSVLFFNSTAKRVVLGQGLESIAEN